MQVPVPHHCLALNRGAPTGEADVPSGGTGYGPMFPGLPRLAGDEAFLRRLGTACGPSESASPGEDDAEGAAGWPFFGQFIAHDVTGDRSPLVDRARVAGLRNIRRQKLNLEFLYGAGPIGDPYLYDAADPSRLLLGANDAGQALDLQRNAQGIAIIPDPRNDSHLIVSQMQVLFSRFHNRVVDWLRSRGTGESRVLMEARRMVTWHYQWIVLQEFLPGLIGRALVSELLAGGGRYYDPATEPYLPLEFADAAFRYGHGQIRETYRVNAAAAPVPMFPDLIGFQPVPAARAVDWAFFFDLPGKHPAQRAKKLDGRVCHAILHLPEALTGDVAVEAFHSLAARDLQRGHAVGLPSGESIARHIGATPLTREQTGLAALDWHEETPLWYYILKESEVCTGGNGLGPVGGRIVGEVLIGLLDHDPGSFRRALHQWRPELPAGEAGTFVMADLIALATGG